MGNANFEIDNGHHYLGEHHWQRMCARYNDRSILGS